MQGLDKLKKFNGSCHCGEVKFEVTVNGDETLRECNCSMCSKTGFVHLIVGKSQFNLLQGDDAISHYQFNTKTADHMFCKHCGIKAFYIPRSHPDGYSINARCLKDWPSLPFKTGPMYDGQNWEQQFKAERKL